MADATASIGGPDPLRPQRPAGLGRGAMLALLVHGGLILALAFGVNWRSSNPTGATAELWAAVPEFAAPAPAVPPPQPTPQPAPQPAPPPQPVAKPEPKPEPKPDPQIEAERQRDAEIAIEKARRERELEQERKKALEKEREEREKERERLAKAEAEKKRQQALLDEEKRKQAEKAEAEKKRQQALQEERRRQLAEKAEAERLEKLRQDNLKRIQGQAGATGGPSATGSAARDAGPSDGYAGRIIARVKPNIVMTEAISGSPRALVEVRAAPDGTIIGRRLIKSSGNKDWDEAVLRALDRTEVLPRDIDGRVPSPIEIGFTP
jgi:colicin import membrane protein